jgi:plastocyanin
MKPLACLFLLGIAISACGGDDGGGGTPPPSTTIAKGTPSGDGQTGVAGQVLAEPLQVLVNQDGVGSAGITVTWLTTAPGADLAPTGTTDAQGIATNSWTLGTVSGPQSAQASLTGASGSPVTFTATATPDAPAALSDLSGNGQNGAINAPLAEPVQAKVSDQFGNGVPGVDVGWSATNATVSAPTVATDASGTSSVNVTLGGTVGPVTIIATAPNLAGSPVTFTATAAEPGPSTATISVVNDQFQPAALTVAAGTRVTWTWSTGALQHNVVPVASQPPRSGDPANAPNSYQFRFDTPGTYTYYCQVHGSPLGGMRGTITVQ